MTAEGRHEDLLWRGPTSRPTPVIGVIYAEMELHTAEYDDAIGGVAAKMDDAFWHRFVRGPFSWSRFTNWWIARRFIVPRDVRRR